MSELVKCFDVVSMVVDEATARFAPFWKINESDCEFLEQYCDAIDSLAEEFDGESFSASVDEIKMTIGIKMECSDMVIGHKAHQYYALAERAVSFGFSRSKGGNLVVEFVFPSVWDKTV